MQPPCDAVILEAESVGQRLSVFHYPDESVRRAAAFAPAPLLFPLSALKDRADARRETVTPAPAPWNLKVVLVTI